MPSYFSTNLTGIHLVVLNAYIGNGTSGETDYHIGSGSPLKGDAQVRDAFRSGEQSKDPTKKFKSCANSTCISSGRAMHLDAWADCSLPCVPKLLGVACS